MATQVASTIRFDDLLADIRRSRKITHHHYTTLLQFTQAQTTLSEHQAQELAKLHDGLRRGSIRVIR